MVQSCLKLLYHLSETINKCVWLRMARIDLDCNFEKLDQLFFKFFSLYLGKLLKTDYGLFLGRALDSCLGIGVPLRV